VRENRTPGSVRGASREGRLYRDGERKMKLILMLFACAATLTGCATARTPYETALRSAVLSVADCSNPGILLAGDAVADVDHEAYFREVGKVAYSFEQVTLGPEVVGYRADLVPCGQGWSGYRHARLFELRDTQLVLVFELSGSYLSIFPGLCSQGRYALAHSVGDDPLTATTRTYIYQDGEYIKTTTTEAQQEPAPLFQNRARF
jgi:hypothetical protein